MIRSTGAMAFRLLAVAMLVAAAMGACSRVVIPPVPPRVVTDSVWRAAVVAYARRLRYDTGRPASARATYGTGSATSTVTLSPMKTAGLIPDSLLHLGWIIGRTEGSGPNIPLGIPAGVGYVWVDSVAGGWRAIHVPEHPADTLRQSRVIFGAMPFRASDRARALYASTSHVSNWRCGSRCCIEGGEFLSAEALQAIVSAMHDTAYPR